MELLRGRKTYAPISRGRTVQLVYITVTMFQLNTVAATLDLPVTFGYGIQDFNLSVQNHPNAIITTIKNDDITCLGDFYQDPINQMLALSTPIPLTSQRGSQQPDQQGIDVAGRCLYRNPIQFMQPCSLITSFSTRFRIEYRPSANGASGTLQGLAFIIASDNSTQGDAKGFLGWLKSTTNYTNAQPSQNSTGHNFAVELDFFQDLQFQDPAGIHVGIDVNSLTSVQTHSLDWATSSTYEFDVGYNEVALTNTVLWIEYDNVYQTLEVFASNGTPNIIVQKPRYPILSKDIDLSEVLSQESMFVGFSGSISSVMLQPDFPTEINTSGGMGYMISEWTFNSNGLAPDGGFLHTPFRWRNAYASDSHSRRQYVATAAISGTISVTVFFLILLVVIYELYGRNARLTAIARKYEIEEGLLERGPQNLKYKALSVATKGFSSKTFLGSGGFGSVYRGRLCLKGTKEPTDVAVKRISAASHQGAREFLAEVKVIGQVQHRNLVRLLGWCHEKGELLLVYDFMPNGSVDKHLYNASEGYPVLTWSRRLKIVSGVATALAYLHEEWEKRVIHRDIKSSNVMLDRDFNARLGDFGLARLSEHDQAPPSTAVVAGTYGYIAPELAHTPKATEKTDVYSFGAMVLEVATGKRPILSVEDQKSTNEFLLVDWVWDLYRDHTLLDAADHRLQGAYDSGEMILFLKIGLLCSHPNPDKRPTMREVLNIWRGSSPFPQLPRTKPMPTFESSADHSAGPDSSVTLPMNAYDHSDSHLDELDSSIWKSDSHSTSTIPSKDDCAAETPLRQDVDSPIPTTLSNRRSRTTSLPI